MKFIVVPILVLLMATQAFSKWVLLLDYELNKEYIAQNLCENKAKPQMNCSGKCQLSKAMKSTENDTSPSPQTAKSNFQEVVFNYEATAELPSLNEEQSYSFNSVYLNKKYTSPLQLIFHPPQNLFF